MMDSAAQPYQLICIGGLSLDLVLRAPALPDFDEKMVVDFAGRMGGGLIANAACAASRLGLPTAWSGCVGGDADGQFLLQEFRQFGVDTSLAVVQPGAASDFCVVILTPNGERTILVANSLPVPPPWTDALADAIACTPLAYTMLYDADWLHKVANRIRAGGGKLAVDIEVSAALAGEELQRGLQAANIIFCSAGGLKKVTGESDPRSGAARLLDLGAEIVVVTLGRDGAYALTRAESASQPAFRVPVVDTTGAGDCFHAAFLAAYQQGQPLNETLRFASAAAALSVGTLGARPGLPTLEQVQAFLADHS